MTSPTPRKSVNLLCCVVVLHNKSHAQAQTKISNGFIFGNQITSAYDIKTHYIVLNIAFGTSCLACSSSLKGCHLMHDAASFWCDKFLRTSMTSIEMQEFWNGHVNDLVMSFIIFLCCYRAAPILVE